MLICLSFGYRCTSAPLAYSFCGKKKHKVANSRDDHVACKIRLPTNYELFAASLSLTPSFDDRNGSEAVTWLSVCSESANGAETFHRILARKPSCGRGLNVTICASKALPTTRQSQSSRRAVLQVMEQQSVMLEISKLSSVIGRCKASLSHRPHVTTTRSPALHTPQ